MLSLISLKVEGEGAKVVLEYDGNKSVEGKEISVAILIVGSKVLLE